MLYVSARLGSARLRSPAVKDVRVAAAFSRRSVAVRLRTGSQEQVSSAHSPRSLAWITKRSSMSPVAFREPGRTTTLRGRVVTSRKKLKKEEENDLIGSKSCLYVAE